MTSSKLGYLNSKLMLRWDSHFKVQELNVVHFLGHPVFITNHDMPTSPTVR